MVIVPKETYPYPPDIPEGRWAVYEVTLPNQPYHPVTITFHTLTSTIALSPEQMTFDPEAWNVSQYLTVFAREDEVNTESPYMASFNMSLVSMDDNYDGADVDDFNVTVEDNDEGEGGRDGGREGEGGREGGKEGGREGGRNCIEC